MNRHQRIVRIIVVCMCCACIIACVIVGRITANSFVDNTDYNMYTEKENYEVYFCEMDYAEDEEFGFIEDDNIESLKDLQKEDVIVVKVKLKKGAKRCLYYESVLSYIEILDVYSGNLKKGDIIGFFEPLDCRETQMDATDGYAPMQEEGTYILFLQQLKNTFFGDDDYVYRLANLTYGKYNYDDKIPRLFEEEQLEPGYDKSLQYEELHNADVLLYDKESYEKYCKLKTAVWEEYK